jgi:hypothetical protein
MAWLMRLLGVSSRICTGKMMMICGPDVGCQPHGLESNPHTWNFVEGFGHVDLSVRVPKYDFPSAENWNLSAVVRSEVIAIPKVEFEAVTSEQLYQDHVSIASNLAARRFLIYRAQQVVQAESISTADVHKWIHSPLGDRLEEDYGSGSLIYLQAIHHLWMFSKGNCPSLTGLSKDAAWMHLSRIPTREMEEILQAPW